ncbi:MAG: hypothetical protein ACR2PI_17550 [Hyphomicrobiaceae bacterium]
MDSHYWPSLYPGIGIGALIGLASGGWLSIVVGAVGGLAGAAVSLELNRLLGFKQDLISLALLVGCAAGVAKLMTVLADIMRRRRGR